ncbi:hypothetical protein K439DRAFT_1639096 [Ramaria rubella]|nr:hypothetical protein K439DRAFT_1639096 [Ramaria rubella]
MVQGRTDNDDVSLTESDFTQTTGSTVWGPGALSGKALKAFGEMSLDVIMNVVIRRRLSIIKRTFDKQPSIFVKPEVSDEVRQMELDLQELRKEGYSRRIRQSAIALFIDMRTIRQRFGLIRDAWNSNRHIFTEPQSEKEQQQMADMYSSLQEMCRPWYSPGIRKMAASVVHRIAEFEALRIRERGARGKFIESHMRAPWQDLERRIEHLSRTGPELLP